MDLALGTTIVRTMLNNPILGTIGIQMTLQCLQTLANTTQEIYGFITTIKTTTHHVNIGSLLMELDLASEILVLESMLKEINVEKNHTQTLAICLKLLQDCLNDIHALLAEVNKRIEYNTKLWVTGYGMREYKFDDLSDRLRFLSANLRNRKQNLIDVIQMNDFLIPAPHIQERIGEHDDELMDVSVVTIDKIIVYEKNMNEKHSSRLDDKNKKSIKK
jgi:hypothetical protein